MAKCILTRDQVLENLRYERHTGQFYRKRPGRGFSAGVPAGCDNGRGYIRISVERQYVLAHRLVWLVETGRWPVGELDHINRDRKDNRFDNLREVSRSENLLNTSVRSSNVSGVKNVNWDKARKKWVAQVRRNGTQYNLGRYDTVAAAADAVCRFTVPAA